MFFFFFNFFGLKCLKANFLIHEFKQECMALSAAKVMTLIPRDSKKCVSWMHCKSVCMRASARCIKIYICAINAVEIQNSSQLKAVHTQKRTMQGSGKEKS